MRKMMMLALPLAVIGAVPGCQTWGPTWSELTGARWNLTDEYRRRGVIEQVDNQGSFAQMPIKIEPGEHRIVMGSYAPGWSGGPSLKVMELNVLPCKRYYLNGQFQNNIDPSWTPVVDYVEDIAGCQIVAKK